MYMNKGLFNTIPYRIVFPGRTFCKVGCCTILHYYKYFGHQNCMGFFYSQSNNKSLILAVFLELLLKESSMTSSQWKFAIIKLVGFERNIQQYSYVLILP